MSALLTQAPMLATVPVTSAQAAMPPEMAQQLAQLRDIHLPAAVSWWPLAPGWWVLLAVVLITAVVFGLLEIRRRRALKYRALRELQNLMGGPVGQLGNRQLAAELCVLIRRIVLLQEGGSEYANVHGNAWGERLAAAPNGMPADIAHFIATAPYATDGAANDPMAGKLPVRQELIDAAEHWIRRHV